MATTQLSDVVIPVVYGTYDAIDSPQNTAFFESGVVVQNDMLNAKADSGGQEIQLPFWRDLDSNAEPNMSNDDPADMASPGKLNAGLQRARISYLNKGYAASDLVTEITGAAPMQRIRNRFGAYWKNQWQRRVIASAMGMLAANIADDAGDMVFDGAAAPWSRAAFTAAAFTLGDKFASVSAVAVHSLVYKQMVDADDIDFTPDSAGRMVIPNFMGSRVVLDDAMPTQAVGAGVVSTVMLFGAGAFGYGEGSPHMPVELERQARAGNGGGVETLWERKTWLLHPFGYQFTGADITNRANVNGRTGANTALDELSPTLTDLANAVNWDRVVDRKSVPLAFLKIKAV